MAIPDADIHPEATGVAKTTVDAHSKPEKLIFYSGWFCPFAQRVWIALNEKKIPYQYREENPYHKEERFLKISPKGLVPALEYEGDAVSESLVILEFLEEAYLDYKPLLPKDPIQRSKIRLSIDHISKSIIPAYFRLLQGQDQSSQDAARIELTEAFKKFANGIKGPFWAGTDLTLADISIIPWISRLYVLEENREFDRSAVGENFTAYADRVLSLPSVKATQSEKQHYNKIYSRYLRNEAQSEAAKATRANRVIP